LKYLICRMLHASTLTESMETHVTSEVNGDCPDS
jgi:hypothetical protein